MGIDEGVLDRLNLLLGGNVGLVRKENETGEVYVDRNLNFEQLST